MAGLALGAFDRRRGVLVAGSAHRDQQPRPPRVARTARRTALVTGQHTENSDDMLTEDQEISSRAPSPRTEPLPLVGNSFDESPFMKPSSSLVPYFKTDHGAVFDPDCLVFLRGIKDSVVDTVFADPPFNLKKEYGAKSNDDIPDHEYLAW